MNMHIRPAVYGYRSAVSLLLAAGILTGCAALPASAPAAEQQAAAAAQPAASEQAAPAGYTYGPEEVMYLSGIRAAASMPGCSWTLQDTDEDGISELFIREESGDITVCCYDAESGQAFRQEDAQIPEITHWMDDGQWADGSIIGVAAAAGDPGVQNDFYLSANYDWLLAEHIHFPGETASDTDMLESAVAGNREAMFTDTEHYQGADIQRLRDYYALATDWDRRNAEGIEPVRKYLAAAEAVTSIEELTEYLTDPSLDPFAAMLGFTVTLDERDTSHWAVELSEDDFSVLPRIYHNWGPEDVADARYEFTENAGHVLSRAGYTEEMIGQILTDCYAMEDLLLPYAWYDEDAEEDALDGFLPFDTVMDACDNFPLRDLLEAYGITEGMVHVYFPKYLRQLDTLYTAENLPMLKAYITAHTAAEAAGYLDYDARTCLADESEKKDGGLTERLNRSYQTELLSPRGPMAVAEENAYMTYFVPDPVRDDLTAMAEDIRDAFREMLENEDWLSEAGRQAALAKLDCMTFCIMRPDTLIDSSYLEVDTDSSFLDASVKLHTATLRHNGAFAGKERIPGDWRYDLRPEIASSYTNAFYYGAFNQFLILAGFVQDAVYRPEMAKEEKLAKLGEIVGHELTHGFDPLGIQFDGNGNMVATEENPCGWMPEEDYAAFQERAGKVADYFDAVWPFPYESCNGTVVTGEATADIGGLSICLKIAEKEEGFDYDRFFRKHAELWRQQTALVRERSEIYNEHPLRHLRINTAVQQFDEFYETYGVQESDRMYLAPADRIAVW